MKVFFSCLVTVILASVANYFITRHVVNAKVEEELVGINDELERINGMIYLSKGDMMRIYHFVAGHRSFSSEDPRGRTFCPECGLIVDLEERKVDLDNEVATLSEHLVELRSAGKSDDQEFKDGVKRINEINTELDLIQKSLYRRMAMEKALSTMTIEGKPTGPAASNADKSTMESTKPDTTKFDNSKSDAENVPSQPAATPGSEKTSDK